MKKTVLLISILFTAKFSYCQPYSIMYHDIQMESQWGSSTVNDDFGCFVRFTPASYPAQLTGVRGYFRNAASTSTIKWKVYSDPAGTANGGVSTLYISPSAFSNPAANGIADQQYELFTDLTSANINITSGDIYLGAVQTVGYFGMGIDNSPDDSVAMNRQWQWMTVFGNNYWNALNTQASSGQFGITAYFNSTGVNVSSLNNVEAKVYLTSDGKLKIISPDTKYCNVEVIDLSGKTICKYNFQSSENTTDLNYISPGIYLVKLANENGIKFNKIIKP